jgi:uncharacterized membrane protein (DUF4010 family)
MDDLDLAYRLGMAAAIGLIVGVERHWRERDEAAGQRTAGVRTFALLGLLGGAAGLVERHLGGGHQGLLLAIGLLCVAAMIGAFKWREAMIEGSYSATTIVAAVLTYVLGGLAALGSVELAAAGGVTLTAILASREFLHGLLRVLSWSEIRSAIILLAMTFVILPLLPDRRIGPMGGVSPAEIWKLAILLASLSFIGYLAVRIFGDRHGALIAGAVGGLLSSTATTLTNARRSRAGSSERSLAAGTALAGAVSLLRTAGLIVVLAPGIAAASVPPLLAAAAAMTLLTLPLARHDMSERQDPHPGNPFAIRSVIQLALLLGLVTLLARGALAAFGTSGLNGVAALSGIADVDAVTLTVIGLVETGIDGTAAAMAIAIGVASNLTAKAVYAGWLGTRRFALPFAIVTVAALGVGGAVFAFVAR